MCSSVYVFVTERDSNNAIPIPEAGRLGSAESQRQWSPRCQLPLAHAQGPSPQKLRAHTTPQQGARHPTERPELPQTPILKGGGQGNTGCGAPGAIACPCHWRVCHSSMQGSGAGGAVCLRGEGKIQAASEKDREPMIDLYLCLWKLKTYMAAPFTKQRNEHLNTSDSSKQRKLTDTHTSLNIAFAVIDFLML